ncbi:MAG: class I SAM-dependent methyltransferase [Myxococcota bacterium]
MAGLFHRLFSPHRRREDRKPHGRRETPRPRSRTSQAAWWEQQWSQPDMQARFLGRPVSPEIVAAVEEGWLPRGGHVLDAGCGEGVVADWMSRNGFTALGVDIAPSAIERARSMYPEGPALRFDVADLRRKAPAGEKPFDVVIDRGCFHQMRDDDLPPYVANLTDACAPDARMLIFYRAYRRGVPHGDPQERARVVGRVERFYAGRFALERAADTYTDPSFGADPETRMSGIVMWLRRDR